MLVKNSINPFELSGEFLLKQFFINHLDFQTCSPTQIRHQGDLFQPEDVHSQAVMKKWIFCIKYLFK